VTGRTWWATTAVVALVMGAPAGAHVDPPGCTASGVALLVSMYRSDGTQGLARVASECERTWYRVTLRKVDPSICGVSGGKLTLTTPDGATHSLADPVPCVGATADRAPCAGALDTFSSAMVQYDVRGSDAVGGILTATARYEGGLIHDGDHDTVGLVVSSQRRVEVVACDDGDPSTTDVCDPTAPGAAACTHAPARVAPESACLFSPVPPDDLPACMPSPCP
jgi:hypothetical protein